MALARLLSRGQRGLDAYEVTVEVHLAGGLPSFTIVGMPAAAVRESKDRVRAALQTCAMPVPARRITAHLGPADVPKEGGRFDLAIALGVVQAEHARPWNCERIEFVGELALSGELRPVRGLLPAVLAARAAQRALVLPAENAAEAALVEGAETYAARHLLEVLEHLEGRAQLPRIEAREPSTALPVARELAEVLGHAAAKRALTIAAAGGHHLLLVGPPGSGKSMLAERLPDLLPPPTDDEALAIASMASVAGLDATALGLGQRPFRAPHHGTTATALIGGGVRPRPGEVSLADQGVLFLDELPEFSRTALEALREPLELGRVALARLAARVWYPARFQLVAAMNPCPCGHAGDGSDRCRCSVAEVQRYRSRLSGPLLDRIDLKVDVPRIDLLAQRGLPSGPTSAAVREAVAAARSRQLARQCRLNAQLTGGALWQHAEPDSAGLALLGRASERWRLSARGATRVVNVARTIADLGEEPLVRSEHVAEALQLRGFEPFEPEFDQL